MPHDSDLGTTESAFLTNLAATTTARAEQEGMALPLNEDRNHF